MPRTSESQNQSQISQLTSEQNQTSTEMDIEPEEVEPLSNRNQDAEDEKKEEEDIIPDLTGIEEETITDSNGITYEPEKFEKCMKLNSDLSKKIKSDTLKFLLAKKKYKERSPKIGGSKEVYIINREWYEKWKLYSRYNSMKRIIKAYEYYCLKPLPIPMETYFPGIINNNDLLIRNKINDKERNILVSKNNDCLDTQLEYKKKFKFLTKERFDLLNNFYKCDCILKAKRITNKTSKNYNAFCVHFNIVFLPTLAVFKNINEENIENFKKTQNIIYDVYYKQSDTKKEFFDELINILLEKPEILSNMGVELNLPNNRDKVVEYIKNFVFYKPNNENKKSPKEMTDFIFSDETIQLIKKDGKIEEKDIGVNRITYITSLSNLFHLNWFQSKDNIDKVEKGIIFIEYITLEEEEAKKLASIFDIKIEERFIGSTFEVCAERENQNEGNKSSSAKYNLDGFPLNKEENKHGLVGLNNLGNTCYMNTGLQCLSNCELLTKYFLNDFYKEFINKDNPIGSKGEIVEKYSQLIHHLWYGNKECIYPIQFKKAFGKIYTAFKDFRQQDTQEFISYLLDALHEDLNKVKDKPYIETKDLSSDLTEEEQFKIKKEIYMCRNQSFIADLIYGFYKSTVYCPDEKCKNISKSFDPFNMITLSLVNEAQIRQLEEYQNEKNKKLGIKVINVTFIPFKINYKPLQFPVKIKKDMNIFEFKKKIEAITGFNKNSFEIYKMQSTEFMAVKPNILLLEDFLKGENKIFLFQIPPYVFDKPLDYFDKVYEELNNDHDKFFLEEEKYEGNDLYKEYNKKEKKNKTDDDLLNKKNKINFEIEKEDEKAKNKIKDIDDIEMKDESLNLDKKKWIKAEFYNYSYSSVEKNNEKKEEYRVSNSRIIYINKEWDNSQIYVCILEMLEGVKNNLEEIKAAWFQDVKEISNNIEKNKKKKNFKFYDYLDQIPNHPLFLQYLNCYNFNEKNIMEKQDDWKNLIFPFDSGKYLIKKIVDKNLENNEIEDIELLFKIIWKPDLAKEYKEGTMPIALEKSEKLEDILRSQREDEILKKNSLENAKESKGKKKNKKIKFEELLNNFNEIEKLSIDNQWVCPKCKQSRLADKKIEIYTVNEVIIFHLKRFRNNRKIENLVEFPIQGLNLKEYLPNKNEDNIYDLFAVANHVGGLHGGHYFAYCKNCIDGEWYEFNAYNVSKIDIKKVVSENAYVLFYKKRREEKINEEESFKRPFIKIDYFKYTEKK